LQQLKAQLSEFEKDGKPVPKIRENLRSYFERTTEFWVKEAHEIALSEGAVDFGNFFILLNMNNAILSISRQMK
jgi:hypothetical protein